MKMFHWHVAVSVHLGVVGGSFRAAVGAGAVAHSVCGLLCPDVSRLVLCRAGVPPWPVEPGPVLCRAPHLLAESDLPPLEG